MLTDKRQILATAAVMAGIVMTAGTVVAEVATHVDPGGTPGQDGDVAATGCSAVTGGRAAHRGR